MQLRKYLGNNQKIEVRKCDDRDWYVSMVQDLRDHSIFIALPYLARRPLFLNPGTDLSVRFLSGEQFYEFESQVWGFHPGTLPYYEIGWPREVRKGQRRGLFRLDIALDVECLLTSSLAEGRSDIKRNSRVIRVKTVNISGSGIRVYSSEPFRLEEKVILKIQIPEMDQLKVPAQVIWTRKEVRNNERMYYSGLRFLDIGRKSQDQLIRYLFKVEARRRFLEKMGE